MSIPRPPATPCFACGSRKLHQIYHLPAIPVQSCILLDSAEAARDFPRAPLTLMFCDDCGFIFNAIFDPALIDYSAATEESQHFSGTFGAFAKDLAAEIASLYDLRGRHTLEIGCGKGDFLLDLARQSGTQALGIDPGFLPARLNDEVENVRFRREYFDPGRISTAPDLILCRHTLEHIQGVGPFVRDVAGLVAGRNSARVVFETPDARRVLGEGAFWDIYYEHCSYFSQGSHARLFRQAGLDILRLGLVYGGQYIVQHAAPATGRADLTAENDLAAMRQLAGAFPAQVAATKAQWRGVVDTRRAAGQTIALWGGGSKAVAFLSEPSIGQAVDRVVDINPHKQGKFLPGSAHRVDPPDALKDARPDVVIVMNPIYLPEIGAQLQAMGLNPDLVAV